MTTIPLFLQLGRMTIQKKTLVSLTSICGLLLFHFAVVSVEADLPPRACVTPHDVYPFCNASLPLEQRLDDLIQRLTLEEKPYLLTARESPKGNISRLGIPECK